MRDELKEMRQTIQGLRSDFDWSGLRPSWMPQLALESRSPLRLTERGQKISDALDAPSIAARLAPSLDLERRAAGMVPYDIQEMAFDVVQRDYVLDAETERRVDRRDVLAALGIALRDRLLPDDAVPAARQALGSE